jgi:glycosyltransferase involved in cell wall biosynthesis
LRFAFCGKLSELKGIDILSRAFEQVKSILPDVELHVFGSDDAGGRPRLPSCVTISGALSQTELAQRLADADCLVVPSRFDSFGMVVIEAMAAGLPVIVSDQVGAKEAVEEGRCGWVLPAGDVAALVNRMIWCGQNPDLVRSMASSVRAQAEHYSWEVYRRRIAQVLSRLLSNTRNPMNLAAQCTGHPSSSLSGLDRRRES